MLSKNIYILIIYIYMNAVKSCILSLLALIIDSAGRFSLQFNL